MSNILEVIFIITCTGLSIPVLLAYIRAKENHQAAFYWAFTFLFIAMAFFLSSTCKLLGIQTSRLPEASYLLLLMAFWNHLRVTIQLWGTNPAMIKTVRISKVIAFFFQGVTMGTLFLFSGLPFTIGADAMLITLSLLSVAFITGDPFFFPYRYGVGLIGIARFIHILSVLVFSESLPVFVYGEQVVEIIGLILVGFIVLKIYRSEK